MKYTFLVLSLISILTLTTLSSKTPNQGITIHIVDSATNESLAGVKIGNKYSDLDGHLLVRKDESISLELISYEKLNTTVKKDTIIKMSSIK